MNDGKNTTKFQVLRVSLKLLKEVYPHNFERVLKSITCVKIGSIHIDGFKNVKKKFNMVLRCHGNQPKSPKRVKKLFAPADKLEK